MDFLIELNQIDKKLDEFLKPETRYPSQYEGWYFLSYYNVLNAIYYEFCGKSQEVYYKKFKSSKHDKEDLPVAWYEGEFSFGDCAHIKGPKGYSGYIPDNINDVILTHRLTAKQKLKLLNKMFNDLKKLQDSHESNGSV